MFWVAGVGVVLGTLLAPAASVWAVCATNPNQQSCSGNQYGVSETFFGSGGELEACSSGGTGYCSKQSAGELTVGNTKGTAYQAQAGFNTDRTEYVEAAIVGSPAVDLGVLDTASTKYGSTQFRVKSYLTHGYVVQLYGTAPTNSGHALAVLNGGALSPGTEQFGLNLAVNTAPAVGAAPVQHTDAAFPAAPFGFGAVDAKYNQPNVFYFVSGDTIASSSVSSGYTTYTISYVANISPVTPGGSYVGYNSIVVTSTF
jgi:hypothetical protein